MARYGQGSIYLRGRIYWIQYYNHGKSISESSHADTERAAQKLLGQRLAEVQSGKFVRNEERVTFEDLAKALLDNYAIKANRSTHMANLAIRHLRAWFGDDLAIDITADRIGAYTTRRISDGLSNSSINYDLAILRRAFNVMKHAGRITAVPHITLLAADNPRQGFLDPADFARLRAVSPEYLQDPVGFLYLSGWRKGEMRSLEWQDIDLAGRAIRLRPENSKNKRGRILKLGGELLEIFVRAHQNRRPDCPYAFHLDGNQIGDFRKAWASACNAAGLGKMRVHDMRRSSVRNMVRAGIPERVAMEVSGHRTRTIFDRYNIVAEADLDIAAFKIDEYVSARQNEPSKIATLQPRKARL